MNYRHVYTFSIDRLDNITVRIDNSMRITAATCGSYTSRHEKTDTDPRSRSVRLTSQGPAAFVAGPCALHFFLQALRQTVVRLVQSHLFGESATRSVLIDD